MLVGNPPKVTNGCLLFFILSFENIEHWRRQVALYAPTTDIILLVGTKVYTCNVASQIRVQSLS